MFRATTKEGKVVEGWYCVSFYRHFIAPFAANLTSCEGKHKIGFFYEIIPSTLGQDTTVKDKNGTPIYGSFPVEGKMSEGGDDMKDDKGLHHKVVWSNHFAQWIVISMGWRFELCKCKHFEVIGQEESKQ